MSNIVPLRPPGHLPTLPAHIQRRFDLAATADEDLEPVYLADAGENAIAVRRAITGPAPTKAIDGFVSLLVRFLGPGPLAPDVLIEALAFSCDDLPPQCWTGDVARQIVRQEKFLPGVAEIRA